MGMFDTFFDDSAEIYCPNCGEKLDLSNGVQSKKFDCSLNNYTVGSIVPNINGYKYVQDYDWCKNCDEKVDMYFGFKKDIFIGIRQTIDETEKVSKKFKMYEYYKKLEKENLKLKENNHKIIYRLKKTIEYFSESPKKSNFHILFSIHNSFLDYNIIQTLKNILNDGK